MPMFVGICVLLAITFVLSRGQAPAPNQVGADGSSNVSPVQVNSVPEGTAPVQVQQQQTVVTATNSEVSSGSAYESHPSSVVTSRQADNGPVIQVVKPAASSDSSTVSTASLSDSSLSSCDCDGKVDPSNIDMGALRAKALASTPPHIIECSAANDGESQSACHLPSKTRYAALKQKGATLWMTGCSGAGKTTIATALEDRLVKHYGKHVYRLDGDNLRTGINRDLTFTEADRAESVRRTGEIATLFAESGVITLVGLISPYREDRDMVRKRHED